jgi:hypothetical protein
MFLTETKKHFSKDSSRIEGADCGKPNVHSSFRRVYKAIYFRLFFWFVLQKIENK